MGLRIIVTGLIAQHPTLGGLAWHYLHYLLGLAELGHDVYYFEDSGQWPYNLNGGATGDDWVARDPSVNVRYLDKLLDGYGLSGKWAYRFPIDSRWFGMSDSQRENVLHGADLLLNVSGTLEFPEKYRGVRQLVYIDTDPVFTHINFLQREEIRRRINLHDVHFTFGEQISSAIPATGHTWRPTRQPVVLSEWKCSMSRREAFTTVMNWTSYEVAKYEGCKYGQKDVELRRFLELPAKIDPTRLEIAMGRMQHANWQTPSEDNLPPVAAGLVAKNPGWTPWDLLRQMGWSVVDPVEVGGDPQSYRNYIESSKAEWTVAKNGYVRGQVAWFSDRSACYLAAGRPVIMQDTGFSSVLPIGKGLFSFRTLDEAVEAIRAVEADYAFHSKAARSIAEENFDARKVLGRLIEETLDVN